VDQGARSTSYNASLDTNTSPPPPTQTDKEITIAHHQATVDTPRPPAQAFAYLSDFTTAAEWDRGTVQSQRLDKGPIGEGTEFRWWPSSLGRKTVLTYSVVEYQPPHAVTFRGEKSTLSHSTGSPSKLQTAERESSTPHC
jgi:hypothetical protein